MSTQRDLAVKLLQLQTLLKKRKANSYAPLISDIRLLDECVQLAEQYPKEAPPSGRVLDNDEIERIAEQKCPRKGPPNGALNPEAYEAYHDGMKAGLRHARDQGYLSPKAELDRGIEGSVEALESLRTAMATWPGDWSEDKRLAWIWGIVQGWDGDAGEDSAMDEVARKFRWDKETIARLRKYRATFSTPTGASKEIVEAIEDFATLPISYAREEPVKWDEKRTHLLTLGRSIRAALSSPQQKSPPNTV